MLLSDLIILKNLIITIDLNLNIFGFFAFLSLRLNMETYSINL